MLTFFCPNCWNRIAEDTLQCPFCGFDLSEVAKLPYDQRMLMSLKHSVPEYRVIAAHVLGERGSVAALPAFKRMIETEDDYYVLKEVLYALLNIKDPLSVELLKKATQHPSTLVSALAQKLLTTIEASRS